MSCTSFFKNSKCLTESEFEDFTQHPYKYLNIDLFNNLITKLGITYTNIETFITCIMASKNNLPLIETCFKTLLSSSPILQKMITDCGTTPSCFLSKLQALDPDLSDDVLSCFSCNPLCNKDCYLCQSKTPSSHKIYYIIGAIIFLFC